MPSWSLLIHCGASDYDIFDWSALVISGRVVPVLDYTIKTKRLDGWVLSQDSHRPGVHREPIDDENTTCSFSGCHYSHIYDVALMKTLLDAEINTIQYVEEVED